MREEYYRFRKALFIAVLCFLASSLSIILIPFIQKIPESVQVILSNLIALVFWLGMLFGVLCFCWTNYIILHARSRGYIKEKENQQRFPGIIHFTRDIHCVIMYIVIILGIALILTDIFRHPISEFLMFPILAITFFAFILHCIVDGKNYKTYKQMREGINNDCKD